MSPNQVLFFISKQENLPQLVPVMYARVYLLKALRTIFLKSLAILEIEPLDQM